MENKKRTGAFSLLYIQTVIMITAVTVLLVIKFAVPGVFTGLKSELDKMLNEKTTVHPIIKEDVPDTYEDEQPDRTVSPEITDNIDPDVGEEDAKNAAYVFDLDMVKNMSAGKGALTQMSMPLIPRRISSPFGYRVNPVTGVYGIHGGIDLSADHGTQIKAVLPGKVLKSKYSSDYGNFITVDHGNGLVTLYAHCSELIAKAGDTVSQGDVIALVGSTGRSTGPHLHFEVRINDVRINPRYYLSGLNEA